MDGLSFNQADGETTLEDLDVATISHAEIFWGADAFKYGALTLGGAINLVPFTGYDAAPFEVRLEGGSYGFFRGDMSGGGVQGKLDEFGAISFREREGFRSIAVRTRKSFLPISVTSSATRSRIDFISRWTAPIGIWLAV